MRARWTIPAASVLLGILFFVAAVIGGQGSLGVGMLAVMAIYSAILLVLSGRSETVGVLGGRPADERLASFNILATAVAGVAAILVAIGGFLLAIARGQSGFEFAIVAAVAGVAYVASLLWFQRRR